MKEHMYLIVQTDVRDNRFPDDDIRNDICKPLNKGQNAEQALHAHWMMFTTERQPEINEIECGNDCNDTSKADYFVVRIMPEFVDQVDLFIKRAWEKEYDLEYDSLVGMFNQNWHDEVTCFEIS